uniref:Dipeptidase n=1 Tax=Anopheles melas TaxID=34690 RepID=A0A182UK51_9DIPT
MPLILAATAAPEPHRFGPLAVGSARDRSSYHTRASTAANILILILYAIFRFIQSFWGEPLPSPGSIGPGQRTPVSPRPRPPDNRFHPVEPPGWTRGPADDSAEQTTPRATGEPSRKRYKRDDRNVEDVGDVAFSAAPCLEERMEIVRKVLKEVPLIDGHNDLPWNIRKFLKNQLREFRFGEDLRDITPWSTSAWSHTDLRRLKEGMVSAQLGT